MTGEYELLLDGVAVGHVKVERQGLYDAFSCRCRLPSGTIHRLIMVCCGERTDLGVCVPMDSCFGVEKRIPHKRLPEGLPEFLLISNQCRTTGKFVPVYPEEPFAYLSKLKDAFLAVQDGQTGIVIAQ